MEIQNIFNLIALCGVALIGRYMAAWAKSIKKINEDILKELKKANDPQGRILLKD